MADNAAILLIEGRINNLTSGINSISEQKEELDKLKERVKKAERDLAHDKKALLELEEALALLKAGED